MKIAIESHDSAPSNTTETAVASVSHPAQTGGVAAGLAALGVDGKILAAQIINFIILVLVLRKILYKPLVNLIEQRRQTIEQSLSKAEELEKRSVSLAQEQAELREKAKAEARQIIDEAKQAAEQIRSETLLATQAETEKLLKKTETAISSQKEAMLGELKQEIGGMVANLTEKLIGQSLKPEVEKQLREQAMKEVTK